MPKYYVAEVDRRTNTEVEFSRIECDSAIDANTTAFLLQDREPKAVFIIIEKMTEAELEHYTHSCRTCDCQFDRRGRLAA